jgi:hypothetical protein
MSLAQRVLEVAKFLKPGEVWYNKPRDEALLNEVETITVRQLENTFTVMVSYFKRRGDGYYEMTESKRYPHDHMEYGVGFAPMFEDELEEMLERVQRD